MGSFQQTSVLTTHLTPHVHHIKSLIPQITRLFDFCFLDTRRLPWEIEEIVCIHEFAMKTPRTAFPIDWNCLKPQEWNQVLTNEIKIYPRYPHSYHLHHLTIARGTLFGTVSCGLRLLHDILFATYDNSHLIRTNPREIETMEDSFALGGAFSWFIQERSYPQPNLYQTSMIEEAEAATFQGDKAKDPEGIYPPLGWILT